MFRRTRIGSALAIAFGGGLLATAVPAVAQQQLERVEITGSAVRRIDAESALPVQVLTREDIARTGATSTADLIRKLPVVQGSTVESGSEGGEAYGFAGVSIHNIGENRTLVLLNGHRLTSFGGQTTTGFAAAFDVNALPLSAIERVEVLTDGASALYGADAIAGVVNFITKRDSTAGDVTLSYSAPQNGGKETRISATKGFGSLADDGFNVMLTLSHDERTPLNARDRSFADTGNKYFSFQGKNYRVQNTTTRGIPANVFTDDQNNVINPNLIATGSCPPGHFRVTGGGDDFCSFDFVNTLEIYPERKRDSFFGSFTKKLGDHELFADLLVAQNKSTSRIAPEPGEIVVLKGSPLWNQYIAPTGLQGGDLGDGTIGNIASYRVFDLGGRATNDKSTFWDLAVGARGLFWGWDYNATITHSTSDVKGNISGYTGGIALQNLLGSGILNPFVGPGQQTPEAQAALNAINYRGYWNGGTANLDTIALRGSREIFNLPAGPVSLAMGVNFNREKLQAKPSLFSQGLLSDPVAGTLCNQNPDPALNDCDQRFGDSATNIPYSASRRSTGAFGELVVPATKSLELNLGLRADHYSDFGDTLNGKLSFRFTPTPQWLLRGSIGSGFHAPSVGQVQGPRQPFGVTNDTHACSDALKNIATQLGAICRAGTEAQYDVFEAGNTKLQPEKTHQATLGLRFEPTPEISLGADLWHVGIRDAIGQISEAAAFGDPALYPDSWTTFVDPVTGAKYIAFLQDNRNLGKYFATGIDLDFVGHVKTPIGQLTSQLTGTYMIREDQQIVPNGPYFSAIGNNNELFINTFRYQARWQNSLKVGSWTHTLGINFKSGYTDAPTDVEEVDASGNAIGTVKGLRIEVKRYVTVDWRTSWDFNKNFNLTFGILNLTDKDPPLSISQGGLNQGQQFGYDDRYYDPRGRTYYLSASYKF